MITRARHSIALGLTGLLVICAVSATTQLHSAEPEADHPPALSPEEAQQRFKVADGLQVQLVAAEPLLAQPLSITFDDRGRMWVLEYRQYPIPNGLSAVEMDEWLRTKYDRRPEPPPDGPKGMDRISIYEDVDGDGQAEPVKEFINDLNLASGMALGHGGVFVVQPPYLLFYADRDRDDTPDGPPDVLLTGFGMEDAHAFANSLTWGPDGWLYGCQGSTTTADIRGIGFQQGVWRYHPATDRFELFAEGGGNSWGVEFDQYGNLFAAGNTVEPLVHHVQGAYYVKGFGKHGPLHNPHAYGYFLPVQHHGYAGDSLTGGAVIYQGGAFPARFNGALIAPNTRHSASRWSTIEKRGSTFATRAAGDFLLSDDIWFRPVDSTVGPDGALYVADWYDYNISHSSPKNRSQWYEPSRLDGRVWRVAPPDVKPVPTGTFDLQELSSDELVDLLTHENDWYVRQARRILAERQDRSITPALRHTLLHSEDQSAALQALWAIYVTEGLSEELAGEAINSPHEYVRAWTIRLLGDDKAITPQIQQQFAHAARHDPSVIVRSQLACTAKRLPAHDMVPIVQQLLTHDEDGDDAHVPLLLWWAIEDKAISDCSLVMQLVQEPAMWKHRLMRDTIISRLARRFMAEGSDPAYAAAAELLRRAPSDEHTALLLHGMLEALAGRRLPNVPAPLEPELHKLLASKGSDPQVVELGLRAGLPTAEQSAMQLAHSTELAPPVRAALIKALGETHCLPAVPSLLELVDAQQPEPISKAALSALGYFADPLIAEAVLHRYAKLPAGSQSMAIDMLCGRPAWALQLLNAVDQSTIASNALSVDQVRRLRAYEEPDIAALIVKHWGRVQASTPLQKQGRITAVSQMMYRGSGHAARGRQHFERICANCHKLHGQGAEVGPDLTGADRKNRELLIRNIVDPSAMIREQYIAHVVQTVDGRVLTGLLAQSGAESITLLDAKNQRTILARSEVEQLTESPISLMPENLLDELTEQQIRDLIAYIMNDEAEP